MHEDSCIGINYAHMFPKCVRSLHTLLGFALYFVPSIQLLSLYQFIKFLTCTRIPCRDSHCENGSLEVLSLHSRRLQQTAVSCKRSNCNKKENNKKIVKVARLGFCPKTANNGFLRSVMSLCMHPHSSTFIELLCHQLEKVLDDWCHCRYLPELSFSRFLVLTV